MNTRFRSTEFDKDNKIWKGAPFKPLMFDSRVSVGSAVLFCLNLNPDLVAQISDNSGVRKTNREIHDATLKIAVNLQKIGCARGDVVGFVCRNHENLAPAVFAVLLLAAPMNTLDPMSDKAEIKHMFGITCPKFVFCERHKVQVLKEALEELKNNAKIIVFGERVGDLLNLDDLLNNPTNVEDFSPPDVDDQTCAAIFNSSGTTGPPKGISVPHRSMLFRALYGIVDTVRTPGAILCFSSLYWYAGTLALLIGTLKGLTRIITTDPYSVNLYYTMIQKYRPEVLYSGSVHLIDILSHNLINESTMDSVKFYICAGSAIPQSVWEKARKHLRNGHIYSCYGMTEVGTIARESGKSQKHSVGFLMAGLKMKVLNDVGEKLGVGQKGELCIKWEYKFLEYYKNPEATAKLLDKDGWIHSGDIGYFDVDNLLHVVGRKEDIIQCNNTIICPADIENVIHTIPGVAQAIVVGIPHPVSAELPASVIVRQGNSSITQETILSAVEKKFSDSKCLKGGVYFVESLPLTPSGKVRRNNVKEIAAKLYRERNK